MHCISINSGDKNFTTQFFFFGCAVVWIDSVQFVHNLQPLSLYWIGPFEQANAHAKITSFIKCEMDFQRKISIKGVVSTYTPDSPFHPNQMRQHTNVHLQVSSFAARYYDKTTWNLSFRVHGTVNTRFERAAHENQNARNPLFMGAFSKWVIIIDFILNVFILWTFCR